MAKKEFTYRGKTLQELQEMSLEDFAELLPTRGKRTLLRRLNRPFLKDLDKEADERRKWKIEVDIEYDNALNKEIDSVLKQKLEGKFPKPIKTHRRDTIIVPKMIGLQFAVYKGNSFEIVEVKPEMFGHYFGEFVLTRKKVTHGKAGIGATRSSTAIATKK